VRGIFATLIGQLSETVNSRSFTIISPVRPERTYMNSLTTMRSCVGSIVRSETGKFSFVLLQGVIGSSKSGSELEGSGINRTEYGRCVRESYDQLSLLPIRRETHSSSCGLFHIIITH